MALRKFFTAFSVLSLMGIFWGMSASQIDSQKKFPFPVTHYQLKNGLEVILSEDYSLPLVSVSVTYNVGSMNESAGKTGLAYLMEHLMFQGSADVNPMQHLKYINRVGGRLNASTLEDRTIFHQTVPSNQLALVLWLESDRMKYLEINETKVEQAKNILLEDIQQRKANNPYFESFLIFDEILFPDSAYSRPLSGHEEDIQNLTVEDVKSFYSNFYLPNNAVLCIAGNFNKIKAKELVAKYFETIPKGKEATWNGEPPAPVKNPVVKTLENSLASSPAFHLGFRIASPSSNEFYTLTIIDYLLLRGQSSRLFKRLLSKEKIALQLNGGIEKRKDRAFYRVFVTCNKGLADLCQQAIFSELDKLKTTFISEEELSKSKNMLKQDYWTRVSTNQDKAIFLSEAFLNLKNFDDLPSELDKCLRVTPQDVVGIVNRYFTKENSIILNIKTR